MPWAALVFDEAHYLKNHTSARSKLARQLDDCRCACNADARRAAADRNPAHQPASRSVRAAAAGGHPLGRSFLAFAKRYCAAEKGEYGWKTGGASNIEELTVQLHGVMLRRSKDDVLALPPKLRTWLPVACRRARARGRSRRSSSCSPERTAGPLQSRDVELRRRGKLLAFLVEARQALAFAKVDVDTRLRQGRDRSG